MTQEGTAERNTGLGYATGATQPSNIIEFPNYPPMDIDHLTPNTSRTTGSSLHADLKPSNILIGKERYQYDYNFVAIKPVSRKFLDDAFDKITDAADLSLSIAERSNSFDEWKDSLVLMSRKIEHFDGNHRKILGSIIASTKSKDISDFQVTALKFFIQATNILRQPRVTKPEVRQILKSLLDREIAVPIPLASDSCDVDELDSMMAELLEQDKKMHG